MYSDNENNAMMHYLIEYTEALLSRMKNGDATDPEKRLVTEMMIKSKLSEELNTEEFSDDDFIKFLSMGWYVYNMLDEKTTV